jgi:hypothetical protein
LLTPEHDYLVDIREGSIDLEADACMFSDFEIYDLGEAVR